MARLLFGGTAADVAEDVSGARVPGATGTVWDGATEGANQVTDLTDLSGAPLTELVADADGMLPAFYGPEDGPERLYLDFGGPRVAVLATDVGERLKAHLIADDPHGTKAAALAEIDAQKGAANGLATLDEFGIVRQEQLPDVAKSPQMVDWLNVKAPGFGAEGDGETDDTSSIQAAINAAGNGGVVYFPKGVYRTSATLDLPKGVTLMGSHSNLMVGPGMADTDYPCYIQALPSFTAGSMIRIVGEADGVHPTINGEQRLHHLMLDGSQTTGTLDGIHAKGNVQNVVLRDVCIRKMPGNGIATSPDAGGTWPYSWRLHSVMVDNCKASGFVFERNTDLTMVDCQAIGSGAHGFKLVNGPNTLLLGCRSEWNGGHGFWFTGAWGNWPGSGSATLSACSTDRNAWDGVRIDATGNGPFMVNALMTRRDGRNSGPGGGGYAGLALLNQAPVVVNGLTCYPGTDDGGTANTSPQYGVRLSGARDVLMDAAFLHAATQSIYDDGTNQRIILGPSVSGVAGNNFAEGRAVIPAKLGSVQAESLTVNATGRGAFVKTTSPADHAMTIYQAATSGVDVAVALNVISDNPQSSAMYLSGKEVDRGTLKITHAGTGTDAGAAAISLDLVGQGTAAQGIFINSTNTRADGELGTTGGIIVVRNTKGKEDFKLSANGRIAMGGGIGYNPTAMVDLRVPNTTTPALVVRSAGTTGANLVEYQRSSDGAVRTRISPSCQFITLETAYAAGPGFQVGSTSGTFGGGSGVLGISNATTVPNAATIAGGGVLFAEGGALKWKGSNGTVTTIAPA